MNDDQISPTEPSAGDARRPEGGPGGTAAAPSQPEASQPEGAAAAPSQPEASQPEGAAATPSQPEAPQPEGAAATPSQPEAPQPEGAAATPSQPEGTAVAPSQPEPAAARRSGWTGGRVTAMVIGVLLVLVSLAVLTGGGTLLWADRTQREAGYVTTDAHTFSTSGSALATEPADLGSAGTGWLYAPNLLDKVRIRVTPASSGSALFVGIGPAADVDGYLAGVSHTLISDFWDEKVQAVDGGTPASAPGTQEFWVAAATGTGAQTLVWEPTGGSWTVVVMNADGRPGIDVNADLGARLPALPWIAVSLLAVGVLVGVGGALLIAGAIHRYARRGEDGTQPA